MSDGDVMLVPSIRFLRARQCPVCGEDGFRKARGKGSPINNKLYDLVGVPASRKQDAVQLAKSQKLLRGRNRKRARWRAGAVGDLVFLDCEMIKLLLDRIQQPTPQCVEPIMSSPRPL